LVEGELVKFIDRRFRGDIVYKVVFPNRSLGGTLTPSRETIPIDWIPPSREAVLETALLEIGVFTQKLDVDWRVKLNGVSVTKEFKPIAKTRIGNAYYTKHVYDVTSVLGKPEADKSRVNLTLKREGGVEPVVIAHIGLIALYSTDIAETRIKFFSGTLSLEPGSSLKQLVNHTGESSLLRTIVYMPSKLAKLEVKAGESHSFLITSIQGMSDESFQVSGVSAISEVEYYHPDSSEKYAPREVGVSSLLVYTTVSEKPEIVFEDLSLPGEACGEFTAKVRVSNRGGVAPDKLLLLIIHRGEVIATKQLNPLQPGEWVEVSIPVKLPQGKHTLVFRAVWRKLAKTWFTEERREVVVK